MGQTGGCLLKIFIMDPLGIGQVNCFRTHNELTMGLLGKYPLAPSVWDLLEVGPDSRYRMEE